MANGDGLEQYSGGGLGRTGVELHHAMGKGRMDRASMEVTPGDFFPAFPSPFHHLEEMGGACEVVALISRSQHPVVRNLF